MVAVASACSGDSGTPASPAAPTTVATGASSSTSLPTTTTTVTTTAAPSRPATTEPAASSPEGHAKALYEAWTRGDRAAAATVAEPEAVAALFARQWQAGDGWSFSECSGATGSIICVWERPSGRLLLRVQNVTGGVPVTVSDVRFQP